MPKRSSPAHRRPRACQWWRDTRSEAHYPASTAQRYHEQGGEEEASVRPGHVVVAGADGSRLEIATGKEFRDAAEDYQRIMRNRLRWTTESDVRDAQAKRSKALLSSLGVDLDALGQLADGGIVQVSVPYVREDDDWSARIFPWEYLLSSATRDRSSMPLIVVRRLVRSGGAADRPLTDPTTDHPLIVEKRTGSLRSKFQFDSSRALVRATLGENVVLLPDPTVEQLRSTVKETVPTVVHLAGVDVHQAARILGTRDPGWDGYMLADQRRQPLPVEAQRLGGLAADRKPRLVCATSTTQPLVSPQWPSPRAPRPRSASRTRWTTRSQSCSSAGSTRSGPGSMRSPRTGAPPR